MKLNFLLALIIILFTTQLKASGFYLDINAGAANTSLSQQGLTPAPTLGSFHGGVTLGYYIVDNFFLGAGANYEIINQYSDVNSNIGNFRGTRLNPAAPSMGFRSTHFLVKGEFEFFGDYLLTNTYDGVNKAIYKSPTGFRILAAYLLDSGFGVGPFYETLSFKKKVLAGVETTLDSPLVMNSVGLMILFAL